MHYSLAPFVGTGRREDPFRPRGHDQPFWRPIDLRPDSTRRDGYALMVTAERIREPGVIDLGPSPDDRWSLRSLGSRLGVTLARGNLRRAAAALLLQESRGDGSRWKPLQPERQGRFARIYRIWLGGLLWEMPVIEGGSAFTETFPTDGNLTGTQDHEWVEYVGTGLTVLTGRARATGNVGDCQARCTTPLQTADHEVSATLVTVTRAAGFTAGGVLCRKANDAVQTWYRFVANRGSAGSQTHSLDKMVAGAFTSLGEPGSNVHDGETVAVRANGSSITGLHDGIALVGPLTDPDIDGTVIGGKHVGLNVFANSAGNTVEIDNLAFADLVDPDPPVFQSIRIGGEA